jgi:ADP-dependent NAD(P)H-hydrate dehydratase / NAD(P)H-hydrate epimerase
MYEPQNQLAGKPLFADLLWSRPQTRSGAGKLLLIGGNSFGFAAVGNSYQYAVKAGAGTIRVLLPDALRKTAGLSPLSAEFAPCTPSGSFSRQALASWLQEGQWSDGILICGDLARNSETAILFESFCQKYKGQVTLVKDAVEYSYPLIEFLGQRGSVCLVVSLGQLQKILRAMHWTSTITFQTGMPVISQILSELTSVSKLSIVFGHSGLIYVAHDGKVSTTPSPKNVDETWQLPLASYLSVWLIQNPGKPFEAITTACYDWLSPNDE